MARLTEEQIRRLAETVAAKIVAEREGIATAHLPITIKVYQQADGFDVRLTITK